MTDVFSEIVDAVRVRGSLYFRTHFVPPWGVLVPQYKRVARFHLVIGGACWVRVDQHEPIELFEGDLIVIPHGSSHVLSHAPDQTPKTVDQVLETTGFSGRGALVYSDAGPPSGTEPATTLVCGHFEHDEVILHPLLEQLPPFVVVRAAETLNHAWVAAAVRFIAHEVSTELPGRVAIVNRLSEILFIQVVRTFAVRTPQENRFLTALSDPRIGRALEAIHRDPGHAWSVSALASEASMSRARFAERFTALVGVPPATYVTDWRIRKAIELLRDHSRTLQAIASAVGFRSDRSFARVFKQVVGYPPGTYRRRHTG
jgi:AraC-like DNA-binding protein